MTVQQLIEELEHLDPETEVRFASQSSWPFEYSISSVVTAEVENPRTEELTEIVYLEEGTQLGYLPSEAKNELMW